MGPSGASCGMMKKCFMFGVIPLFAMISANGEQMNWEFEGAKDEPRWVSVDDGVMGGLSKGGAKMDDGSLNFSGTLSLENSGGFSSIRTRGFQGDLSDADGITMRIKGDGRTYQLRLQTDAKIRGFSSISYGAEFETVKGEWREVKVPFSDLKPSWRGRQLDGPKLNIKDVREIGVLLGDKKAGDFKLEVDWLKTYRAK